MTAATDTIVLVVTVMGLGVAAQVLADKLAVPSVLFLILAGVAVGPEGLGVINPQAFGQALPAIVGLSVAIIVFEGAFHLHIDRLRQAPFESIRLVTVGALISLVGTALVVRYALGTTWGIAFLISALLVATGPTVITPIMNVVAVRERVSTTLETEGVANDVTAAILAIVTFEYVVLEDHSILTLVSEFALRFGIGIGVGVTVAGVVWYVLRHVDLSAENAPQNARLIVLIAALGSYGIAELIAAQVGASEAGIAAVATGGFVLGNADIPYREEIEQFKGDVTLLVLAFVFIVLAALLSVRDLLALGLGGLLVVGAVTLVVRPALVLLCTTGGRFSLRERLFIGAIGPRGIIPASVATLFALDLQATNAEAASTLVGTVFLVILATVVFQGGFARHIAEALDVIPMRVLVIGGGRVGRALAERLEDRGEEVVVIDNNSQVVEDARRAGFTVRHGDGTDVDVLEAAGAHKAKVIAPATGNDDVNLLVAQLAKNRFDVETVIARVNQPANVDAFEDLDVEAVPTGMSVAWSMDNFIERPGIAHWMTEMDRIGDVQEIELTGEGIAGKTVADIGHELPDDCYIALINRDGESRVPHADDVLYDGDHITFIGQKGAVRDAIEYCTQ
ncbi:cation:proton antiporter [Halomicroarcula sp. F13]|uniref:Cation:proton antiporter n=1 Tax=Haloarcula rubra TaxID=2487747 RepID=A0AAW4PX10_9EURY|nr:cation:proton antiporter [Halomicroarcula rubra]MBX0325100.1 cation:proton antiporter [Halomicroarcula rubra]